MSFAGVLPSRPNCRPSGDFIMIVSHKHKFIFFKPHKVAGTSVHLALSEFCGKDDIITRLGIFRADHDQTEYKPVSRNESVFTNHSTPEELRSKMPEIYSKYTKITIVRNPWDAAASAYWWHTKGKIPFVIYLRKKYDLNNERYYFSEGKPICDIYLRYERLEKDYQELCKKFGFEYRELPRTKTLTRSNREYRYLFNEKTKARIKDLNRQTIYNFGYRF